MPLPLNNSLVHRWKKIDSDGLLFIRMKWSLAIVKWRIDRRELFEAVGTDNNIVANLRLTKKIMKRSCTLSHPPHQTIKTLWYLSFLFAHTFFIWKVTKKVIFKHHFCPLESVQWQCTEGMECTDFPRNTHIEVKIQIPF